MKEIVDRFRRYVVHIGVISFVIDMLMLTPPLYMLSVLDKVVTSRSNETLFVMLGIALYAILIMGLLENLRTRLFDRFGATLKTEVSPKILELNLHGIHQSKLARHGIDDIEILEGFLTGHGIKALFAIPWIPILIFVLYLFHPALAATALVLAVILLVLAMIDDRLTASHHKRASEISRQAVTFARTARQNVEAVGSMGMQQAITTRWGRLNTEHLDHGGRAARISALILGLARFIRVGGQMVGLTIGAWLLLNQQGVTQGIMVASLIIMGRALSPIDQCISAWKQFVSARGAYARLKQLMNESEAEAVQAVQLPRPHGHLAMERVFLQAGPQQRILNGIDVKVPAGESLGIIGPTGSGKTSLARLIVGLQKPTQGHVRLDGAEVYQWAQSDLGQYVGYLPQEAVLFPGTIAENIARMRDPEQHTDAVIAAAKKARVHGLILKLPQGYDTEVGEGGARLSGGQRQLVGLARALFGNPSLVVLDEPNANLDSQAELALSEVIRSLKISRVTLVIIAHKPSVIRDMDKLLVLRDGNQALFGRTADVLRQMTGDRMLAAPSNLESADESSQSKPNPDTKSEAIS